MSVSKPEVFKRARRRVLANNVNGRSGVFRGRLNRLELRVDFFFYNSKLLKCILTHFFVIFSKYKSRVASVTIVCYEIRYYCKRGNKIIYPGDGVKKINIPFKTETRKNFLQKMEIR